MATKEHTLAFNERQKQRGLKRVPVWVPADRADELKQIAQQMRDEHEGKT